jgi:hypothetical protein
VSVLPKKHYFELILMTDKTGAIHTLLTPSPTEAESHLNLVILPPAFRLYKTSFKEDTPHNVWNAFHRDMEFNDVCVGGERRRRGCVGEGNGTSVVAER